MKKIIQSQELQEADILLYHGESWLSKAIRFFDNSDYNHASLYTGDQRVTEAIAQGVVSRELADSIRRYSPVTVLRLINRPSDMSPVIRKSEEYTGNRYAYEQLLLLALICSTRKIRLNNAVARFVARVLESAAAALLEITHGDKEALICSELVYRSYDEVLPGGNDPYTILLQAMSPGRKQKSFAELAEHTILSESLVAHFYGINGSFSRKVSPFVSDAGTFSAGKSSDAEMEALLQAAEESYLMEDYTLDASEEIRLKADLDRFIRASSESGGLSEKKGRQPNNALQAFIAANANFVTPGDLFRASNLQALGDIK